MKKFLSTYVNPNKERLNYDLINRKFDRELVEYIVDSCKSLEILEQVTFLGYEYITDESVINTDEYIDSRNRAKNKKDKKRYRSLKDSRYAELRLRFRLECKGEVDIITKKLLIPVPDEKGYHTIKGTQYFLMYQIVDNSTYTTKKTLTLKSMTPVSLKMKTVTYQASDGTSHTAPTYTIGIFRKDADIMMFYLAKIGVVKTLEYFYVDKIMSFESSEDSSDDYIYFGISSKMFLRVNKYFFKKYSYVKTITFMFLNVMTNRMTFEHLQDKAYWTELIGAMGTTNKLTQYDKGLNTLTFLDRIIDNTTKKILKVDPIHKKNIYAILRWMICNFNELRKKDNLDLTNKRLRCNEYIAALLTKAFSDRINRIISLGNKVTIKNIREIFKFPGDLILQQLHRSGLLRYDDRVNDMDFFGKLKVTFKGPNSLGGNNENNIAAKYRGIDPSYLGRLDINVCGTSDPGTSAILTPFCKTDGLYFDSSHEPEDFKYHFDKDVDEYFLGDKEADVHPDYTSPETYYNYLRKVSENNRNITFSGIRSDPEYLYIEIPDTTEDDI